LAVLRHVESGSTVQNALTVTVTLGTTLNDVNKSFLVFGGGHYDGARPNRDLFTGYIKSTTQIEFQKYSTGVGINFEWFVVEFTSGVSVNHVTVNSSNDTFRPQGYGAALTGDPDPQTSMLWFSCRVNDADWYHQTTCGRMVDEDNVEFIQSYDDAETEIRAQVITYSDSADFNRIPGRWINLGTTDASGTEDIREAAGTERMVLGSFSVNNSSNAQLDARDVHVEYSLSDSDTVAWSRGQGATPEMGGWGWFDVYEFKDGTTCDQFTFTTTSSNYSGTVDITSAGLSSKDNAILVGSTMPQIIGETDSALVDRMTDAMFSLSLDSTTQVTWERRDHNGATASCTFYVIDFSGAS